jgi:hypothetical protein
MDKQHQMGVLDKTNNLPVAKLGTTPTTETTPRLAAAFPQAQIGINDIIPSHTRLCRFTLQGIFCQKWW